MTEFLIETTPDSTDSTSESGPAALTLSPDLARRIPPAFLDADGGLRLDLLLEAFHDQQRRLAARTRPDHADSYDIKCDHGLFAADPAIDTRLHEAGYSREQAQLLYDLAAERLLPLLRDMAGELEADRELDRLISHFGGAERWQMLSRQIQSWAERNLPADTVRALAATADGVMALHRMMASGEPGALAQRPEAGEDSADLRRLVADPRYWRDRDPGFIARVTEGFRRSYGS
jgi:hypothetical protein